MKAGDWVTWKNGTAAGQVIRIRDVWNTADVQITTPHLNGLSVTSYSLPYPIEELTVVPEAIAKIINS